MILGLIAVGFSSIGKANCGLRDIPLFFLRVIKSRSDFTRLKVSWFGGSQQGCQFKLFVLQEHILC